MTKLTSCRPNYVKLRYFDLELDFIKSFTFIILQITENKSDPETTPKLLDLESSVEMLKKENDVLKKRCEQFLMKEKLAKDEIRDLKSQLLRK